MGETGFLISLAVLICMSLLTVRLDIFQTHTGASGFLFLITLFLPLHLVLLFFLPSPMKIIEINVLVLA